jgi:hypothetical protein
VAGNPGGDTTPLESLTSQKVGVNILNQGEALFNVQNPNEAKFRLYPKITSASLAEGSWAGGSLLVLSGSGLIPRGGSEAILVIFGEEGGSQKSCAIVDIAFDYISCLVPDFTDLKGAQTDLEVPVTLQMGYQSEAPTIASPLKFNYRESLLATADSMSPGAVSGNTEITVTGTNFGSTASDIQVFAQNQGVTIGHGTTGITGRRKRSIEEEEIAEITPEELHKWWYQRGINMDTNGKPLFRY